MIFYPFGMDNTASHTVRISWGFSPYPNFSLNSSLAESIKLIYEKKAKNKENKGGVTIYEKN